MVFVQLFQMRVGAAKQLWELDLNLIRIFRPFIDLPESFMDK